jgi:hypothetical protein
MGTLLVMEVRAEGLDFEAGPHDVPLVRQPSGIGVVVEMPLNEWLRTGLNRATVTVRKAAGPPGKLPSIDVAVRTPEQDATPLYRFGWRGSIGGEVPAFSTSAPFTSPGAAMTALWADAARIERPEGVALGDMAEIQAAIEAGLRLHQAFAKKKVADVVKLLAFRTKEMDRAYPPLPTEPTAEKFFGRMLGRDDAKIAPIEVKDVKARLLCDGQLVYLTRGEKELITIETEDGDQDMPVFVALVKGEWIVAR